MIHKVAYISDGVFQVGDDPVPLDEESLQGLAQTLASMSEIQVKDWIEQIKQTKEGSLEEKTAEKGVIVDMYEVDYPTPADPMKQTEELASHLDEKRDFVMQHVFPETETTDVIVGLRQDILKEKPAEAPVLKESSKKLSWQDDRYTIIERYYGHHQVRNSGYTKKKNVTSTSLFDAWIKATTDNTPEEYAEDMELNLVQARESDEWFLNFLKNTGNLNNEEFVYTIFKNGKEIYNPKEDNYLEEDLYAAEKKKNWKQKLAVIFGEPQEDIDALREIVPKRPFTEFPAEFYTAAFVAIPLPRQLSNQIEQEAEDLRGGEPAWKRMCTSYIKSHVSSFKKFSFVRSVTPVACDAMSGGKYLSLVYYLGFSKPVSERDEVEDIQRMFPNAFIEMDTNALVNTASKKNWRQVLSWEEELSFPVNKTAISLEQLIQLLPEWGRWFPSIKRLSFLNLSEISAETVSHSAERHLSFTFLSARFEYFIGCNLPNKKDKDGYMGCTVVERRTNKGNDLEDGVYSNSTWNRILSDIKEYETKTGRWGQEDPDSF